MVVSSQPHSRFSFSQTNFRSGTVREIVRVPVSVYGVVPSSPSRVNANS